MSATSYESDDQSHLADLRDERYVALQELETLGLWERCPFTLFETNEPGVGNSERGLLTDNIRFRKSPPSYSDSDLSRLLMPGIANIFLPYLHGVEPHVQFSFGLPIVTSSAGNKYYAKLGNVTDLDQYIGEAESLKAIHNAAPGLAPQVFASGIVEGDSNEAAGRPYFLSEYKDIESLSGKAAGLLGERIARELHAFKSSKGYGFDVPTYCGATRQENGWFGTWEECYGTMIENLLLKLNGRQGSTQLIIKGEEVRSRVIPWLLRPLNIEPVLLHGDLWSGNTGFDRTSGQPVIFDPSSYFGHNEAELAIARMFGGIPSTFFTSYHENIPPSEPVEQYDLRADLYEVYHYLNHTVLFGGGYANSALGKMNGLLGRCPL